MRQEVQTLVRLGPLPNCDTATEEQIKTYESLLSSTSAPPGAGE